MPNNTIADNLQRLVDAKNDIADAIVAKGGTVNEGDGLEEFSADIATIPSGGGDSNFKSNVNVTTEPNATVVATRVYYPLKVYAPVGAALNVTDGYTNFTGVGAGENTAANFLIPLKGTWKAMAVVGSDIYTKHIDISEIKEYEVKVGFLEIYGASWSGGSKTTLTRTDDAAEFDNPDPYVNDGSHPGYSPFDGCFPWSNMNRVTIDDNELIEIPKFWYKITTGTGNAISFQIANYPAEGFNVSPAHQDRGDGVGERDFAYVGRYHSIDGYKSQSGELPITKMSRATARSNIKNLGTGFYLWDYATLVTIWLLYIVEFANWNSQTCIGRGGGNGSSKQNTGKSNLMPYHTGTMQTSRNSAGVGCQYRGIEDLWGNVFNLVDGIRFSSNVIYLYKNPSEFSDTSGGVYVGSIPASRGYIKYWYQSSTSGYEWAIYPGAVGGSYSTYVPDYYIGNNSSTGFYNLIVGCSFSASTEYGLFYFYGTAADNDDNTGVRVMYLPSNN